MNKTSQIYSIEKVDSKLVDNFILNHPKGNIFQTTQMFETYQKARFHDPNYLVLVKGSEIRGVLLSCIISEHTGILGKFSTRSIIIGGPLIKNDNSEDLKFLLGEYVKLIGPKCIYSQFRNIYEWNSNIDSSLGFKCDGGSLGFIDGQIKPFSPFSNDFLIIPLVIMDCNFVANKNRWGELKTIVDYCRENEAYLVINFHNHVFNELEYPGFKQNYRKLIMELKNSNSEFLTLGDIYDREMDNLN